MYSHRQILHGFAAMGMTLLLLCAPGILSAEKLPKATKTPKAPNQAQDTLIREGIALHDSGDFAGAARKYNQILSESEDVVDAMFELSFSLAADNLCTQAMDVARRGAEYRSNLLPRFHMILGSCLDELGMRMEAIALFKAAIKLSPDLALLHYNLALTYVHAKNMDEARKELQHSLHLDPDHASSHYFLAVIYEEQGYRIPAVMAASRFLLLEPQSERARDAIRRINELLLATVTKNEKTGNLDASLQPGDRIKTDEGDFLAAELGVAMSVTAAAQSAADAHRTPFTLLAGTYKMMSGAKTNTSGKGFAAAYYAPFFSSLQQKELIDAFVYQSFLIAEIPGAADWGRDNEAKLLEFRLWNLGYHWPRK